MVNSKVLFAFTPEAFSSLPEEVKNDIREVADYKHEDKEVIIYYSEYLYFPFEEGEDTLGSKVFDYMHSPEFTLDLESFFFIRVPENWYEDVEIDVIGKLGWKKDIGVKTVFFYNGENIPGTR